MARNSDLFFTKAKDFQDKRIEIMSIYEKRLAELEKAKGSQLYKEESEKATQTRDADLQALQNEYRKYFRASLDAMADANGKRGITPPTASQIAILQALKMRDSVSQKELDQAWIACKDNAISVSILNEIGRKNGYIRGYHSETGELSADEVDRIIDSLRNGIDDFMAHDTTRAARTVAAHNMRLYGMSSERPLKKRQPFADKVGCFNTLLPFGMSEETCTAFCKAIDEMEADK